MYLKKIFMSMSKNLYLVQVYTIKTTECLKNNQVHLQICHKQNTQTKITQMDIGIKEIL